MCLIDEIVEIEEVSCLSRRYDITVADNHNFFANNILVHNCQNVPSHLTTYKDIPFYVTQKIDGSSITIYLRDGEFGVASRNMELYETEGNAYWKAVRDLDIENKLRSLNKNIVLQGELFGPGIQKNREGLSKVSIAFFNVYDPNTGLHYDYQDFVDTIAQLGLSTVPVIATDFYLLSTVEEMLVFAEGKSVINPKSEREGLVFRPMKNIRDELTGHRLSFKVISNKFLLKNEE